MSDIVSCRACGTARWRGDVCANADCPRNNRIPAVRNVRASAGSNVQATLNNPGTHWLALSNGPRLLTDERYIADFDGRHYIASREV